jgi:hypothetical protein
MGHVTVMFTYLHWKIFFCIIFGISIVPSIFPYVCRVPKICFVYFDLYILCFIPCINTLHLVLKFLFDR